jgi:tRNA(fMet)-specific endonuclease VapC
MSFLLDTNICSANLKDERRLFSRFVQHTGNLFVSRLNMAELYAWAYNSSNPDQRLERIKRMLELMDVIEFDDSCALHFGQLQVTLRRSGVTIDAVDLMIAATALVHDLTMVTHNTRDFVHVPGLRVEDWLAT